MLDEQLKETIRRAYSEVSKNVPNFRSRVSQRTMIAEITKTITKETDDKSQRLVIVEGPTGTGKTLAYLLSTIPAARALNKRLVISTATIALQEQLVEKDIPLVLKHSGLLFRSELAKGRGRYICPSKIVQSAGTDLNQTNLFQADNRHLQLLKQLYSALEKGEWDGDRDRWPEAIADDVWLPLTNDRHGCLNARCRYFHECPFFIARGKLEDTDVIVANHDLVLADLMLGGGVFLPEPEDTIYVFDEAHHLADKAVEHSGNWMRLQATVNWLESIPSFVKQCNQVLPKENTIANDFERLSVLAQELVKLLNEFYLLLARFAPLQTSDKRGNPQHRFPSGKVDAAFTEPALELLKGTASFSLQLDKAKDWIGKTLSLNLINTEQAETLTAQLGQHVNRAQNLFDLWTDFSSQDNPAHPPKARWIEALTQNNRIDYLIAVSPITAAGWLAEKLWSRCYAAVLTSATLTALGSFSRLRYSTGLPDDDRATYLKLDSPFNYHDAATLWIPFMRSDPANSEQHTHEIAKLLPSMISDRGGTLVLFSSRHQMERVADLLGEEWTNRLLIQNSLPKHLLLEKHKQKIDHGEASVIFGLASFAEGIDLPGDLCTHVIIAKLPFAVPDTPVEAAEREYLEAHGKNHFFEVALTEASIKLNQAVGRLLRTETDIGIVSLLDRRVLSKAYGKLLLNSLPPMKRSIQTRAENEFS